MTKEENLLLERLEDEFETISLGYHELMRFCSEIHETYSSTGGLTKDQMKGLAAISRMHAEKSRGGND